MSLERQITCINKTDRFSAHERIRAVGGSWGKEEQQTVIRQIEAKTHSYYVSKNGHKVYVKVSSNGGNKYIKTENDDLQPNNLLSLPEC